LTGRGFYFVAVVAFAFVTTFRCHDVVVRWYRSKSARPDCLTSAGHQEVNQALLELL
jgi:hypothetical protein